MRLVLNRYLEWSLLLLLVCSGQLFSETKVSSETDLKKRADHYFAAENFEAALPDYSRLLSLYPTESIYNYRFGVCLLLAGKEKANASTYIEAATKDPSTPEDVWYFLGKSFMINNDFSKANDSFEKFKKIANALKQKKYDIEACIQNCKSGIELSKKRKNIVITNSSYVGRNAFFNNYDFSNSSGKIVNAAEQFQTEIDRAKVKEPVMYIGDDKQKILIASYGKKDESGKDIYIISKTPDNLWSAPENLGFSINTSLDEDFPFLARDGRTLYFSSKGHNSIGGYDIFKTVYNFNTKQWSNPENLGMPINTTGDDILFVPNINGTDAVYSTTVESTNNAITIRSIKIPGGINEMVTISGVYIPKDQKMRRDARISILTSSGDGIITSVHTDPNTGKYELVLQPGQNYMIVVEGGGYLPHAEIFDLPSGMVNPDLKQVVKINKDDQKEELSLQNFFSSEKNSTRPYKSITRSYSTKVDSSSMISVKINDQIIFVTPPSPVNEETANTETISDSSVESTSIESENTLIEKTVSDSSALPEVKIKKRDKYDPTLEERISTDQLKQQQEEAERMKDIESDETAPEKSLDFNVSNEDLAKIAYSDAQTLQDEADSSKNEVELLRIKATEKQELALLQKNQSENKGLISDSINYFLAQSELNRLEAEEINKKADELSLIASSKQAEANTAIQEANEIFNKSKTSEPLALKRKASVKKNILNSDAPENSNINSGKTETVLNSDSVDSKSISTENGSVTASDQRINLNENKSDSISTKSENQNTLNAPFIPINNLDESSSLSDMDDVSLTVETNNACRDEVPIKRYDQAETLAQEIKASSDSISAETIKTEVKENDSSSLKIKSPNENSPLLTGTNASIIPMADSSLLENNLQANNTTKSVPMPVKEEARVAYREYQVKMKHSNELTTQSLSLQDQISHLHSCPERDSLIRESNNMAIESIHEWQEALKKIQEARKIDSGVEYKMNVNDYASNSTKLDKNIVKTTDAGLVKQNDSTLQANAVISKPSLAVKESKFNYTAGSTDSSIKYLQDKNDSEANLDTLHPDYPMYFKLKKEITSKQVETIDVFAEAINLNNKSVQEKENELALMDSAYAETDKDKKSDYIKRSFEQKALSEKHAQEAKEKFAIAQQHTQEVKGLRLELASVKDKISRKSDQNVLTASSKVNSGIIKKGDDSAKAKPVISPVKKETEKNVILKKQAPVFAMTSKNDDELSVNEEAIESVDITKKGLDDFTRNVFGKNQSAFYSEKNPIPMNPDLPDGLVFKVQIGAFHKPLPSDIFKGLQPISGETTRPGWIRYCAGLFKAFEPANIVKKEIQRSGYKDAFVVAYFNGKRIELNEAYAMLKEKENLMAYKNESAKEIAMLRALNIHSTPSSNNDDKDLNAFYGKPAISSTENATGLTEYSVQVGVYRAAEAPAAIASIQPLQTVPTKSNLFRFTSGRYSNRASADSAKMQIIKSGIKDAFIVVYKNGVVLNNDNERLAVNNKKTKANINSAVAKKENSSEPVSQPGQLIYKIQIGAFKNDVPYNMVESFLAVINKGISVKTDAQRGLHIFYIGNCNSYNEASVLQTEIVSKGVKDAFIVALKDGKRIPITEEMKK